MDKTVIKALQERTGAKLRYAGVHLDELEAMPSRRGDNFERAHQESFLYHLLGVVAFAHVPSAVCPLTTRVSG